MKKKKISAGALAGIITGAAFLAFFILLIVGSVHAKKYIFINEENVKPRKLLTEYAEERHGKVESMELIEYRDTDEYYWEYECTQEDGFVYKLAFHHPKTDKEGKLYKTLDDYYVPPKNIEDGYWAEMVAQENPALKSHRSKNSISIFDFYVDGSDAEKQIELGVLAMCYMKNEGYESDLNVLKHYLFRFHYGFYYVEISLTAEDFYVGDDKIEAFIRNAIEDNFG